MLPIQDEIMVAGMLADRLAAAEYARLARAVAPARSARGRRAVALVGRALVRLGCRLEAAAAPVPPNRLVPPADRLARI